MGAEKNKNTNQSLSPQGQKHTKNESKIYKKEIKKTTKLDKIKKYM